MKDTPARDLPQVMLWQKAIVASELESTTRLVALTLATHMDANGGSCRPGQSLLASETGLNLSTVRRHLRLLRDEGWLSVTSVRREMIGTQNHYRATFTTTPQDISGAETTSGVESTSAQETSGALRTDHCASAYPTTTSETRSQEVSIEVSSEVSKTLSRANPLLVVGFDAFWGEYPNKQGKPNAKKAWNKHRQSGVSDVAMIAGARRWATYWTEAQTEGQFIPHPTTWLNRRAWEDDPPVPSKRSFTPRNDASRDDARQVAEMFTAGPALKEIAR